MTGLIMNWLPDIAAILLGAIVGSFLNVCIYRLPRNKSIVTPSSFCPSCERPVRLYHNIPVVAYIALRGRCRDCGAPIPFRYPFVEAFTALLFYLLYRKFGFSMELPVCMLFVSALIIIIFVDIDFMIIPDILSLGGIVVGFALSFLRPSFSVVDSLLGILIGGGILYAIAFGYQLVTRREGMGGGDIKLLGMIGAFWGIKGVLFSLMSGSIIGAVVGIPMMFVKGKEEGTRYAIPFGPFLSLGALVYLFYGEPLIYMLIDILYRR